MNADDLERVDRHLRDACTEHGLRWVVQSVDEMIREGRNTVEPRDSYREWIPDRSGYYPAHTPTRRPSSATLGTAAFSPTERVVLLIDALLAVFTGLPATQISTLETLRRGWEGRAPTVGSIIFLGEAGEREPTAPISSGVDLGAGYQILAASLQRLGTTMESDG